MSRRIEKVNSLLKQNISEIINELNDPRIEGIISVANVSTTPDLKFAKVSLSIYSQKDKNDILKAITSASGFIRHELASRIDLRYVPTLNFELDNSAEYSEKINNILNTLDVKDD